MWVIRYYLIQPLLLLLMLTLSGILDATLSAIYGGGVVIVPVNVVVTNGIP